VLAQLYAIAPSLHLRENEVLRLVEYVAMKGHVAHSAQNVMARPQLDR
jgi:hypothetical protein